MKSILPEEAQKIIESGTAMVIDVRTPVEFAGGHIPSARNININDSTFFEEIKVLEPSVTYIVNCQSGGRSARACVAMQELGFVDVQNLEGGIVAWRKAGFGVEDRMVHK